MGWSIVVVMLLIYTNRNYCTFNSKRFFETFSLLRTHFVSLRLFLHIG